MSYLGRGSNSCVLLTGFPDWIEWGFGFLWAFVLWCFHRANGRPTRALLLLLGWSLLHSVLAHFGFYQNTDAMPPRFGFVLIPAFVILLVSLLPRYRNRYLAHRDLRYGTLLHTVRFPVELTLFALYEFGAVPELMTFAGRNYDILIGLSAPLMFLLLLKKRIRRNLLIAWNVLGLMLLLFILGNAVLSAELPIQQFAFDQPNRAPLHFPFILLPAVIVPVAVWTHLTDLIFLIRYRNESVLTAQIPV